MKIAIEAQRIFRSDKHGMDFVILETLKELQKRKDGNHYYVLVSAGEDRCLEESENLSIIEVHCPSYPLWEQLYCTAIAGRPATLYIQYSSVVVPGPLGTDIA